MSLLDVLLLVIIAAVFVAALLLTRHSRKSGAGSRCGCSCDSCEGCISMEHKTDKKSNGISTSY